MVTSEYFKQLIALYEAEIDDLRSDSDGRNVLAQRLRDKREHLSYLLPLLTSAPEMVAPVFYNAFTFTAPARMAEVLRHTPEDDDFPTWAALAPTIAVAPWAQPLITKLLATATGETFLVTAAALEFARRHGSALVAAAPSSVASAPPRAEDDAEQEEDEVVDLAEAGNEWLAEQGFDKLDL